MQGVFEPVLEALLREQPQWARHGATGDPGLLLQIAATAGLDAEAARTQMLSPSTVGILNRDRADVKTAGRSEEHTSELQSLMRISYAVFCLKKKKKNELID